jgi:type II secretory pathway predicted ATPase ExeA
VQDHLPLTRGAFDLTDAPSCFVPAQRRDEALAALNYGVLMRMGFVVVTGEVGGYRQDTPAALAAVQLKESQHMAYGYIHEQDK